VYVNRNLLWNRILAVRSAIVYWERQKEANYNLLPVLEDMLKEMKDLYRNTDEWTEI